MVLAGFKGRCGIGFIVKKRRDVGGAGFFSVKKGKVSFGFSVKENRDVGSSWLSFP